MSVGTAAVFVVAALVCGFKAGHYIGCAQQAVRDMEIWSTALRTIRMRLQAAQWKRALDYVRELEGIANQ